MGQRGNFQAWIRASRLVLLLSLGSSSARSQTPDHPREAFYTALQFSSPPECATAQDFVSALARRGVYEDRGSAASAPETPGLEVEIHRSGLGYRGTLIISADAIARRTADAASCGELVEALALVVAVSLGADPDGPQALGPSSRDPAPRPTSAPKVATQAVSRPEESESKDRSLHVRASALVLGGALTGPSLGPGLGLSYEKSRASWLDWDLGAEVSFAPEQSKKAPEGLAHFSYLGASLRGCLAWLPGATLHLHACGQIELGQLLARASGLDESRAENVGTFALGPRLELRYSLAGPWSVFVAGEGALQLNEDRFFVQDQLVHEIPALWLRGALGVSYRLFH